MKHRIQPSVTSFMSQESSNPPANDVALTSIVSTGVARRPPSSSFAITPNPDQNAWLIELKLTHSPEHSLSLAVRNELVLGRGDGENSIDLTPFDAANLGVSRRHLLLRPTLTNLFIIDLSSTNGTLRNGLPIGINTPYPVVNDDVITVGRLALTLNIIKRPSVQTGFLRHQSDLADAQAQIAKAITSQLHLDDVLNQVVNAAIWLASAGEASIWLVDEETGEWVLEAEQGMERDPIDPSNRMRLTVNDETSIGQVIRSGKPMRVRRQTGEESLKMATGYMVEALLYVPITLGGVTFGVLAAAHRDHGKQFRREDEEILAVIADYAAIAIQNARLYHVTDQALERRINELAMLNEVTRAVSASLDLNRVYDVLVEQVNNHWPVEALRLYLLDGEKNELYPFAAATPHDSSHISIKRGIMGQVVTTGQLIINNKPDEHPAYDAAIDSLHGQTPQCVACVPLRVQDHTVGVLTLYNKADSYFTEEDTARLEALAYPVATAVENARLFRVVEQQRSAIQAIAQVFHQPLMIIDEKGRRWSGTRPRNTSCNIIWGNCFRG
ncbi:MAG: GAF domain-containing protein [Chloroflexi bacterium]|nr:GAF domain-containing protein [Chloroflexota bacterium]